MSYDDSRDKIFKMLDYLQTVYSNYHSAKDSNKVITAIECASILLKNKGGKIILFNASSSWITANKFKEPLSKQNGKIVDRNEMNYSNKDTQGYLSKLARSLSQSLISIDLFQISAGNANSVFFIKLEHNNT